MRVLLPVVLLMFGCAPAARRHLTAACRDSVAPPPNATFFADVEQVDDGPVLRKRLTAYPSFGGYDVAYTGQVARWTFRVPAGASAATLVLSMAADDHATAAAGYRYTLWSNGCAHDTPVKLPHGAPAVAPFENWIDVALPIDLSPRTSLTVTLQNTSQASPLDWIAVRSIELRLAK